MTEILNIQFLSNLIPDELKIKAFIVLKLQFYSQISVIFAFIAENLLFFYIKKQKL